MPLLAIAMSDLRAPGFTGLVRLGAVVTRRTTTFGLRVARVVPTTAAGLCVVFAALGAVVRVPAVSGVLAAAPVLAAVRSMMCRMRRVVPVVPPALVLAVVRGRLRRVTVVAPMMAGMRGRLMAMAPLTAARMLLAVTVMSRMCGRMMARVVTMSTAVVPFVALTLLVGCMVPAVSVV